MKQHFPDDYNFIFCSFMKKFNYHFDVILIESIKTTSMEDVSTRVLEKIKNI